TGKVQLYAQILAAQLTLECFEATLAHLLGEQGIAVRAGHHCAMPLLQRLEVPGALRVSLGLYNDADDLERFFLALDRSLELLR
ncbi:aminotransferase class V-fold PLP-dependent enzyme, partial [Pseudomonas aeruginosa]|nr:aminotransferase class V-fold PLP-dependent enzyme [Pseudomonas aeruginosa]